MFVLTEISNYGVDGCGKEIMHGVALVKAVDDEYFMLFRVFV